MSRAARTSPNLARFLEAVDIVREYVEHLQQLFGVPQGPTSIGPTPSMTRRGSAYSRKAAVPKGTWTESIKTVLKTENRPMRARDIVKYVAGIRNVKQKDIRPVMARALYEMKRTGQLRHNKATGVYLLPADGKPSVPVVERVHADT